MAIEEVNSEVTAKKNSRTSKKRGSTSKKETVKEEIAEEKTVVKAKPKLVLKDNDILNIESLIPGKLVYINKNTGEEIIWDGINDIRQVSVVNVREMKARQRKFFADNWVRIIGSAEAEHEDYTVEDIYKSLTLNNYYHNSQINIKDLILNNSIDKIREYVNKIGRNFKVQVITIANDMIGDGTLDSFKMIRDLEAVLDTRLRDFDE